MKMFRLYWHPYDGQPREMPRLIEADRYAFRPMGVVTDPSSPQPLHSSSYLLEFFIGDEVVATLINLPEGITFDEGIAAPSSVPE